MTIMSESTPSVAVVTRTKDRPLFLERALRSVHGQSFGDFVHVVINDGGDPGPVDDLLQKYSELTQGRVRLIHNHSSSGMEAASNKALKSVSSTFVAIHDDDDTWHKNFLRETVATLEKEGAMGVVVKADKVIEQVSKDGNSIKKLSSTAWMPNLKVVSLYRQCIDNQMTPITFLYRREIFNEIGYYDENLPVLGDWDFGIRFLQKYDVEFLDPGYALAFYHHRKFVTGSGNNNSFGEGHDKHRYWSNKLMNKYLRQELAEGRLGVGYIMSHLKYNQSYAADLAKKFLPKFLIGRVKSKF
jgi:glycosyltransferase involved in cell wall biosynthesis